MIGSLLINIIKDTFVSSVRYNRTTVRIFIKNIFMCSNFCVYLARFTFFACCLIGGKDTLIITLCVYVVCDCNTPSFTSFYLGYVSCANS